MKELYKDLDELMIDLKNLTLNAKKYVFRGYQNEEQLKPQILRMSQDLVNKEYTILQQFEKYATQYINITNPIDLITWAQHYGLPTRLLDFTYNPYVALFFSLYSENEEGNYFVRYCKLNNNIIFNSLPIIDDLISVGKNYNNVTNAYKQACRSFRNFGIKGDHGYYALILENLKNYECKYDNLEIIDDCVYQYASEIKEKIHNKKILFISPSNSNPRIQAQQGLFMFPYELNSGQQLELIKKNTKKFQIDKSLRNNLMNYIKTIGIDAYRLMPDLASICSAINHDIKLCNDKF